MQIPITNRLRTVAEMIGETEILCDIGCDHGYLPIYLIKQQKIKYAYACDLRDGPLQTAAKNIAAFHMKDVVKTVKSDGLKELSDKKINVISICGMGGRLIAKILENDLKIAHQADYMVLQPQSEIPVLRRFLAENGFYIQEERVALEDRRFYIMMRVFSGDELYCDEMSYILGQQLLVRKDDLTRQYFSKELSRHQAILDVRKGNEDVSMIQRIIDELKKYR